MMAAAAFAVLLCLAKASHASLLRVTQTLVLACSAVAYVEVDYRRKSHLHRWSTAAQRAGGQQQLRCLRKRV